MVGHAGSRDCIVLSINKSYMRFQNVQSEFNGRHGLYQRASWATSWTNCEFRYNGGLGIFLDALHDDPGVSNGVSFIGCESRWNGGPVITGGCRDNCSGATFQDHRGGVKVVGAAMVQFVGGVYESNSPWGFVIDSPYFSTREVSIEGIYAEANGHAARNGGTFYIGASVPSVKITNSWLAGSGVGPDQETNLMFANNGSSKSGSLSLGTSPGAELILRDNFVSCAGGVCNTFGVTRTPSEQLTSVIAGDTGASGTTIQLRLLNASDDGVYMVAGTVYVARTGQASGYYHGAHPFMVSRDAQMRSVSIGPSTSPSGTNVSLTFAGDALMLTFAPFEYGFVTVNEQMALSPTVFGFNSMVFPTAAGMRRA